MSNVADPGAYRWALRIIAITGAAIDVFWLFYQSNWYLPPYSPTDWLKLIWGAVGSAVVAVLIFQFFFERWIWRWDFLRNKLVRFPDLTGTWFVTSKSDTFGETYKAVVYIDHNFDKINYTNFRSNPGKSNISSERSEFCGIDRNKANELVLYLFYENKKNEGEKYSHNHNGCRWLTLKNERLPRTKWFFVGNYWTDKPVKIGKQLEVEAGTKGVVNEMKYRGREELFFFFSKLSPPSEPCVQFSRTRLSSR